MSLQPRKQANAIHILPNISRSKGNQTMKLGQLTDYNMRNNLNHTQHVVEKLFQNPSLKNQNWAKFQYAKLRAIERC